MKAIKRIAIEFCQDVVANGVLYVEARYCPHLMLSETAPEVTPKHVVQTVLDGFKEAETKLGLKVYYARDKCGYFCGQVMRIAGKEQD